MLKDTDHNLIIRLLNNAVILLKINEFSDFQYCFYVLEPNSVKDVRSVRNTSNNAAKAVHVHLNTVVMYVQMEHLIKFFYRLLSFEVSLCGVVLAGLKLRKEGFVCTLPSPAQERPSWSEGWRKDSQNSNWDMCRSSCSS